MTDTPLWQHDLPEHLPCLQFQAAKDLVIVQSLTAALRMLPEQFSVELLYLGEAGAGMVLSDCDLPKQGFVRDVYLKLDNIPVVWARSFCAADDETWKVILDCGTHPLGERLFDGSLSLQRTPFSYAVGQSMNGIPPTDLLRRSFFELNDRKLALVEGFMPHLWQVLQAV